MTALLNPTACIDDCPPLVAPARARRRRQPVEPDQSMAPDDSDDLDPEAEDGILLGCCLVRALLLAGKPAVAELPPPLALVAGRALATTDCHPNSSDWLQVVEHVRDHHETVEALLQATGPLRPPLPGLRFLIARTREPVPRWLPFHRQPRRQAPVRWARDLSMVGWLAAHRIGHLIIVDRPPDLRLSHLLNLRHCLFECPLINSLIP